MYRKTVLALSVLLAFGPNRDATALEQATPTQHDADTAELLFQGMKDSRERLVSGEFWATSRKQRITASGLTGSSEETRLLCKFDFSRGLLHFERNLVSKTAHDQPSRGVSVLRPEYTLQWSDEDPNVVKRRGPGEKLRVALAAPFDIRCMGLAYSMTNGYVSFADLWRMFSDKKVVDVATERAGIYRIVLAKPADPGTFNVIWFNKEQGCSPIRIEVRCGSISAAPRQRAETTWRNVAGVWVPNTFVSEMCDAGGKLEVKTDVAFEWRAVNEPVPEQCFTAAGMGVPSGANIVSKELGRRVVVATIDSNEHRDAAPSGGGARRTLTAGAVILLAGLIVVLVIRRRRRRAGV